MTKSPKQNLFDIRLHTLPDRMHVLNNMDVNTRAPLPSMQLWEAVFHGRPMSFQMFEEKWPGLVSVDEYLSSFEAHLKKGTEQPWRQVQ
jgi:hypothetical protein